MSYRASLVGQQLANFKVERLLGRGGMAEVYFGRDVNLQRPVAIKVIDAQFRQDASYAERFVSEARTVATWRHENIVHVYYADRNDDLYYFVMEYIDGMDLASLLREYATAKELMPHADVVRIGRAVASALDYAHKRDVIHRDVKPANVMVSSENRVVLMDFGLALDVQQGSIGEVFGTPHYVSPEQARRSADAVPQSDVYSLGIMLFEMLTGSLPFDDPSATAIVLQHLSTPPPSPRSLNPDLNQHVEDVLLKALSKQPEDRYRTASELIDVLEKALSQKSSEDINMEYPALALDFSIPQRSISSRTVSEHVALNVQNTATWTAQNTLAPSTRVNDQISLQPDAHSPVVADVPPSRFRGWMVIVPVLLLMVIIGSAVLLGGDTNNDDEALALLPDLTATAMIDQSLAQSAFTTTPTEFVAYTPSATSIPPSATDVVFAETVVEPTATVMQPSATPVLPTPTVVLPTPIVIQPTATILATEMVVPVAPTILYPSGQRIGFFWNDSSFYWHNPTGNTLRVSSIDFEALDESGNVLSHAYDGARWSIGYSRVEPGKCVSIELLQMTGFLRPAECRGYNSTLTLRQNDNQVFWLPGVGKTQFRVLWDGQEVGRCQISDQNCEVRIP
ncbi:MAG: protein kinase [Anaerolineae bacterium]|nr:protein kinase [Anaerolineae bacterium]